MTTTHDLAVDLGTTYRFVVLDCPFDDAVEALASLATRRTGTRTPVPGAPGFHVGWPRRVTLTRLLSVGTMSGRRVSPPVEIRGPWRLSLAIASVELLPWDDRHTELALRLGQRWLLSAKRYDQVAEAVLAMIGAELTVERAGQRA